MNPLPTVQASEAELRDKEGIKLLNDVLTTAVEAS